MTMTGAAPARHHLRPLRRVHLHAVRDVDAVTVDVESQHVAVVYDEPADEVTIRLALRNAGYNVHSTRT
jgi:hypothetical protein